MHKTNTAQANDGTWHASCSCGWTSPEAWATQPDAEAETEETR